MKKSEKQFVTEMIARLDGASEATLHKLAKEMVDLLAERRELYRMRKIIEAIDGAWACKYGAATITVETAYELNDTLRKKIKSLAPGAELRERIKENLIGGARIQIDEQVIDATVDGQLKRLQTVFGTL
jgi:F0F1-type ATP synthase delta subunit